MPDNHTTALVKAAQSPALARVSNQLTLTEKLLAKPEEPFLIPYRKGKKWGFCDRNKNIVIDCVYDEIDDKIDGFWHLISYSDSKEYYVNKKGRAELKKEHYLIDKKGRFLEGIDYDGRILNNSFEEIDDNFKNDLCVVKYDGNYGCVDRQGNYIILPIIPNCFSLSENFLFINKIVVSFNAVRQFNFSKNSNVNYYFVGDFNEGLAPFIKHEDGRKIGFIDYKGIEVIPPIYDGVGDMDNPLLSDMSKYYNFNKGLSIVCKGSKGIRLGVINKMNINVLPCEFGKIKIYSNYIEAHICEEESENWSLDNSRMNLVYCGKESYEYFDLSGNKLALPLQPQQGYGKISNGLIRGEKNGKWGYMNENFTVIISSIYDVACDFFDGLACVKMNGLWGSIDEQGKVAINLKFKNNYHFSEGIALVDCDTGIHSRKYFINKKGEIILDLDVRTFKVKPFKDGLAAIMISGKWGFIDKAGNVVIKPAYKYLYSDGFNGGIVKVSSLDKGNRTIDSGYVDKNGVEYWED